MNIKRLFMLSFFVKCLIAVFFVGLLSVHYLLSQIWYRQGTVNLNRIEKQLEQDVLKVDDRMSGSSMFHGYTGLMLAARWGNVDLAKLYLKYMNKDQVNLRADNLQGDTALHVAIRSANEGNKKNALEMIKLLLDHGADPNLFNTREIAPIHLAIFVNYWPPTKSEFSRRWEVVKLLADYGADLNAQIGKYDTAGLTPKEIKQFGDYLKAQKLAEGDTHLHIAAKINDTYWVKDFLDEYGPRVDLMIKDKRGMTALEAARRFNYGSEMTDLLGSVNQII